MVLTLGESPNLTILSTIFFLGSSNLPGPLPESNNNRQTWANPWKKPIKWLCAHRKLRSAWVSAQSDQSSLCAQWVAKDLSFLHVDSEDCDQTGRMPRLIWFFAVCTVILLVLSWGGSHYAEQFSFFINKQSKPIFTDFSNNHVSPKSKTLLKNECGGLYFLCNLRFCNNHILVLTFSISKIQRSELGS